MNGYQVVYSPFTSPGIPSPPDGYFIAYQKFIYNEPRHLLTQPCAEGVTFYLLYLAKKRLEGRFNLFVSNDEGKSPCRAPFGSLEFSRSVQLPQIEYFLEEIHRLARSLGVISIRLINYPFCYAPYQSQLLAHCLLEKGYAVVKSLPHYYLVVDGNGLRQQYSPAEKRRLNKCLKAGYIVKEITEPNVEAAYELIKRLRLSRGHALSLDLESVRAMFIRFPEACKVFVVKDQEKIIAATIAIVVNEHSLYNFYPAHDAAYHTFSPLVLLTDGLYQFCQQHGFTLLDLGTALTETGEPNLGLMRFKQNLGAQVSLKMTFEKTL